MLYKFVYKSWIGHICDILEFAANGSDEVEDIISSETTPVDPATNLQTEVDGADNVDLLVIPPDNFVLEDIVRG